MNGIILIVGLIVVLAAAVTGAIVTNAVRKKDFNDQVSGKKPERSGKDVKVSYDKPQGENPMIAADREGLRMKSGQNLTSL